MATRATKVISALSIIAGFAAVALPAAAITLVPQCAINQGTDAPGLDCVLQTFRNIGTLIIGITGSFALFMFVYGGFMWITSAGNEKKVSAGKTILTNAVIGIILIFISGYVVDYIFNRLTQGSFEGQQVGAVCNNGAGRYVQNSDGNIECQTPCSQVGRPYQCLNEASGVDCNSAYTGCPSGTRCCVLNPEFDLE